MHRHPWFRSRISITKLPVISTVFFFLSRAGETSLVQPWTNDWRCVVAHFWDWDCNTFPCVAHSPTWNEPGHWHDGNSSFCDTSMFLSTLGCEMGSLLPTGASVMLLSSTADDRTAALALISGTTDLCPPSTWFHLTHIMAPPLVRHRTASHPEFSNEATTHRAPMIVLGQQIMQS